MMKKTAMLSADGKYRYELTRTWDLNGRVVAFIGLNPSTADASNDDPTIRKCMKYARRWGYGGLLMLNVFAYRATDPKDLKAARNRGVDIIGMPENSTRAIAYRLRHHCVSLVVCAWGAHAGDRGEIVMEDLRLECAPHCFKKNADRSPAHPLYQRDDAELVLA
jgi:hypothetical protein